MSTAAKKEQQSVVDGDSETRQQQQVSLPPAPQQQLLVDSHLNSLEQGQRRSFYQIKDLERRVDFIEKELGSCRYIVESQSRLIKRLLVTLPAESKAKNAAELNHLVTELNQNWHEPSFDPYPYHPSNYRQSFQNNGGAIGGGVVGAGKASSTPSVNSHGSQSNSNNNSNNNSANGLAQQHASSNGSAGNRSDSGNGAGNPTLTNTSAGTKSDSNGGGGYGSSNSANPTLMNNAGVVQRNLNYQPFNNQATTAQWTFQASPSPDRYVKSRSCFCYFG